MIKHWICLVLVVTVSRVVFGDSSEENDNWYDDYYLGDIGSQELFQPYRDLFRSTVADSDGSISVEKKDVIDQSADINEYNDEKKFEEEIEKYVMKDKSDEDADDDNFNDYQFEDNRLELDDAQSDDIIHSLSEKSLNKYEKAGNSTELSTVPWEVNNETDQKILEETKSVLNENTVNDFANDKNIKINLTDGTDNSAIFEETSKILVDSYDSLGDETLKDYKDSGEEIDSVAESDEDFKRILTTTQGGEEKHEEEDTVDKAYSDLMDDLNRFHGTLKKLNELDDDNNSDYIESDEKNEEIEPNDYEEIGDEELEKIFENNSKSEGQIVRSDEKLSEETSSTQPNTHKILPYINDALIASDIDRHIPNIFVKDKKESDFTEASETSEKQVSQTDSTESTQTPDINEMSSAELDVAIKEFAQQHQSFLDIKASDVRNAINIRVTVNTPVEVTSPDYPLPYPTNNTVDWMFIGEGVGVELNITEFSINGHLGDYLLVKPGGDDSSGSSGLIFTYTLRDVRRYRFLDVDKMFVRFVANPGNQFMRGFRFSTRMVAPRPNMIAESEPEPKPVIPVPQSTITVNLGGISLQDFIQVEEKFRHIVGDMALLYINANGIDPGLNTTLESTQITRRAFCFRNWPKFESCVEVRFGVPLVYEEERTNNGTEADRARLDEQDLADMWAAYSLRDPFAARLRSLGIMEYQIPNDKGVLALWLVVAAGVVISAALLAIALWRFSCFEDYTRMPTYGDAESLAEKRTLDLYPTPHQTLPPLYETDYKWPEDMLGDKVDAGFTNSGYLFESRERPADGYAARGRNYSFSPRDVFDG